MRTQSSLRLNAELAEKCEFFVFSGRFSAYCNYFFGEGKMPKVDSSEGVRIALDSISRWWEGSNDKPLVAFTQWTSSRGPRREPVDCLPTPESQPRFREMVDQNVLGLGRGIFCGAELPVVHHSWGSRGTPMVNAAYLGGKVSRFCFVPPSDGISTSHRDDKTST
jgi:hypothetical protein